MDWKEVNEAIKALLATAAEGKTGDEAVAAKAKALDSLDASITQPFFDKGFASADGKRKGEVESLTTAKKAAEDDLEATKARLVELEKKNPDIEVIKKQYEGEIQSLKDSHSTELDSVRGEAKKGRVESFIERARAKLETRFTPEYSELYALKMRDRVRPTTDGVEVLQPGKDIPYHASDTDELLNTITEAALTDAPDRAKRSDVQGGAGVDAKSGGDGSKWDKYRERAKGPAGIDAGLSDESKERRLSGL